MTWRAVSAFALAAALTAVPSAMAQGTVDVLDTHHLPLGDGRISRGAEAGSVFSCQQRFPVNAPGAQVEGPWIHGTTWDLTEKLSVQGDVKWPDAQFRISTRDDGRVVSRAVLGNGLPVETSTGTFPIPWSDPAYRIDRNPNAITPQLINLTLPANPANAPQASCVPMGLIGVALNGVAIFNALDAGGRDAVAHEVQDPCSGHPERQGAYHYHGPSSCLPNQAARETLIGYALDGFGIYSYRDATGRELTNADLDACHGRTSEVDWNGVRTSIYHYVLTREYPYTVGCFRGTPVAAPAQEPAGGPGPGRARGRPTPPGPRGFF